MRRLRYQVATSLDGYIAGPNGEFDWITMDPDIDFKALYKQFDTVVMGGRGLSAESGDRRNATFVATAASASSLGFQIRLRRPELSWCVLTLPTSLEMSPRLWSIHGDSRGLPRRTRTP